MIKIVAKINFRSKDKKYEKGGVYDVDEQDAAKFCRNGWAYDMTGKYKTRALETEKVQELSPNDTKIAGKVRFK